MKKISFLFGAGVSIPAGLPTTQDITDRILSGDDIHRHSCDNYCIGPPVNMQKEDKYVNKITQYLKYLRILTDKFYKDFRTTNYEDLYYINNQILDCFSGEYDNPAVQPIIDKIESECSFLFLDHPTRPNKQMTLHELSKETKNYIRDFLDNLLHPDPGLHNIDYLKFIIDANNDSLISKINIFTLNHDTILEKYFNENKIEYCDGFTEEDGNRKLWNKNSFNKFNNKICLFKLHGSTDWYRYGERYTCKLIGNDREHPKNTNGVMLSSTSNSNHPVILIGTFNKIFEYQYDVFYELHHLFRESSKKTDYLIISGYSFNDKSINARIGEFIHSDSPKKALIIHPDPSELRKNARLYIERNWEKFNFLEKKIEDTNLEEIKEKIFE